MTKETILQAIEFLCQRARDPKNHRRYNMNQILEVHTMMYRLVGDDQ